MSRPDSTPAPNARPEVVIVAAVARNGVIGRDNDLVWRIPEDMAHFKRVTAGCTVVMGRRTWDSLPPRLRPLPGRRNLVLTRQRDWRAEGAEVVASLEEAVERAGGAPRLFVLGGAQVYAAALPLADSLVLTEVDHDFEGDTHFPAWDRTAFEEVARERLRAGPPNDFDVAFVTWRRRR